MRNVFVHSMEVYCLVTNLDSKNVWADSCHIWPRYSMAEHIYGPNFHHICFAMALELKGIFF